LTATLKMRREKNAQTKARVVRIVVASPGDVQAERDAVEAVANELNRDIAADRKMVLRVIRWETDASPGFHPRGPQAMIDSVLRIDDCDLLIGIFWKRFGTPVMRAGSGTEHEIRQAYKNWKKHGNPQILIYFNEKRFEPVSKAEKDQWNRLQKFKERFPVEGLWWKYKGARQLTNLIRKHLTLWILDAAPSQPGRALPISRNGKRKVGTTSTTPKGFLRIKLSTLKARRVAISKDYEIANDQLLMTLSDVDRNKIRRQILNLESELIELEREIAKLENES
jgi:hypothetical protein